MNRRMIFNAVGIVLKVEAVLLLLPALVSALYRERSFLAFIIFSLFTHNCNNCKTY